MAPASTLPMKGLFVAIVMCSHFRGYVEFTNAIWDSSFVYITNLLGRLMVAMFLFYSGFGLYEQIKSKGSKYVDSFVRHRLLPTWLSFAICVLIYWVYGYITGNTYGLKRLLLSLTGWDAVGNSNWFMFVTFALYIAFYIVFKLFNASKRITLIVYTGVACILLGALYFTKQNYWWDTLLCFPAGMWYSFYKNRIDKLATKNSYWLCGAIAGITFLISYIKADMNHLLYPIASILFCIVIVGITMKVRFKSWVLAFLGKHVFSIYILQRLVYMVLQNRIESPYLYFGCSVVLIIIVATLYDKAFEIVKGKLFC